MSFLCLLPNKTSVNSQRSSCVVFSSSVVQVCAVFITMSTYHKGFNTLSNETHTFFINAAVCGNPWKTISISSEHTVPDSRKVRVIPPLSFVSGPLGFRSFWLGSPLVSASEKRIDEQVSMLRNQTIGDCTHGSHAASCPYRRRSFCRFPGAPRHIGAHLAAIHRMHLVVRFAHLCEWRVRKLPY